MNYGYKGGVIYLNNSCPMIIFNVSFNNNSAYIGGGIIYMTDPIGYNATVPNYF